MAGVDDRIVRQGEELFADALEKGCVIPAGKIRCSDTFVEKDVAADDEALAGAVKADATGGVTRQEEDGEPVVTQQYGLPGDQEVEVAVVVLKGHPPALAHCRRGIQDGQLFFVEIEG